MKPKDELRRSIKLRLAAIAAPTRVHSSQEICRAIGATDLLGNARLICAFLPLPTEPNISPLWADSGTASFCFPRIRGDRIDIIRIEDRDLLSRADWRMADPAFDSCPILDLSDVDTILVPGLAFAPDGRRLGRGGGWYDRLLASCDADTLTIGICFHTQLFADLPTEAHDRRVARVVTESGIA